MGWCFGDSHTHAVHHRRSCPNPPLWPAARRHSGRIRCAGQEPAPAVARLSIGLRHPRTGQTGSGVLDAIAASRTRRVRMRRTSTRTSRSMPMMRLVSATTALRQRPKKRCELLRAMGLRRIRDRSVGRRQPWKWRVRAIWPTNTGATRIRRRKKTVRTKYKRGTTCWCGGSRPAAIGRSR